MTKAAIIVSAVLLFAGVAAAGSLSSLGGPSGNPTTDNAPTLATSTTNSAETTTTETQPDRGETVDDDGNDDHGQDNQDDNSGRGGDADD